MKVNSLEVEQGWNYSIVRMLVECMFGLVGRKGKVLEITWIATSQVVLWRQGELT